MNYNPRSIFDIRERNSNVEDTSQGQEATGFIDGTFLCLLNKNGMLGAAYYSFQEKTLNVYEEMADLNPQYLISSTIYRELAPRYILTFGNVTEEYVKVLIDFFTSEGNTTYSSTVSRLPENFFLGSLKDYAYETCKTIVSNINVASNTLADSDHKQELYVQSCINLNHRLSVQALAALYKYLEKHWSVFGVNPSDSHFLHISQVTFNILLSPINDRRELEKRLSFIKFAMDPINSDFIASIQDNIKQFRNVSYISLILYKILNARASNQDWNALHKMIYHAIFINDISKGYRDKSELLRELNETITEDLRGLQQSISNALDFVAGNKRGRPVIKCGLDENLDAKLLLQQDVTKHVTAAARFAVNDLPDYIDECTVVYLPEMGHLMAIKEWEPNCDPGQLQHLDYQFMFAIGGINHYKNPLCVELDKRLGDINAEIIDHENRIMRRLSAFTLKYNKDIRAALKMVAVIDCLIAMAKVAQQNNYVKPELNDQRIHEIDEARHPLTEQLLASFEPNSFRSGGPHSHMKIVTGANGSGKSIYLKQILLTVYLAHVGCFVPAKKANIGLVDSVHCRLHTTESAVVRLSAFMIDVTQTTQALHYATPSSLIILDEFGRGTLDDDGLILLAAFLKSFLVKNAMCPHILVSTHLQRIATLLPKSKYLEYLKMDHTMENGTFCFLYKISPGIANSFAFDIASTILGEENIRIARHYFQCLQKNELIRLPDVSVKIQQAYLAKDSNVERREDDII